jgi:hypothetical protein
MIPLKKNHETDNLEITGNKKTKMHFTKVIVHIGNRKGKGQ